ncbi:MAG: family 10 glycosylhydrolase [Akkermansiaceae bacterium]|nr:family 10 glycosylhydrolase [Armatimonadota bacterium]
MPLIRSSVFCSAAVAAILLTSPVFAQVPDTPPTKSEQEIYNAEAVALNPQLVSPEEVTPSVPPTAFTSDGEIRAMWVVRDSMHSRAKIRNTVNMAKKNGFNTLFVQVRGRGDAFYNSRFEPRSEELSGVPADFDPLAVAVEEGHKAGLEVHAWLNTFFVWGRSRAPWSSRHVVNAHPEWLVRTKDNRVQRTDSKDCEGAFLNPAIPAVRDYLRDVFNDVATNYAVDGVHMDYVRMPANRFSFGEADMRLFRDWLAPRLTTDEIAYADAKVARGSRLAWHYLHPKEWAEWRRDNVTAAVREISAAVHATKPDAIVSAAVFPNYRVAHGDKGQAWREWLNNDLIDAACPMSYNQSTQVAASQIRDAVRSCPGKPIIAGVGAWQVPSASAVAKGKAYRHVGAAGINFFSYDGMTRNGRSEKYLNSVGRGLFGSRSAPRNWRRGKPVAIPKPEGVSNDVQP